MKNVHIKSFAFLLLVCRCSRDFNATWGCKLFMVSWFGFHIKSYSAQLNPVAKPVTYRRRLTRDPLTSISSLTEMSLGWSVLLMCNPETLMRVKQTVY